MNIKEKIKKDIKDNPITLYMKGTPDFPQCGFSKTIVEILSLYQVEYKSFDVLQDLELREGIKEYFDWPTIPQLIVNQELVGGCDIILELHEKAELKNILHSIKNQ